MKLEYYTLGLLPNKSYIQIPYGNVTDKYLFSGVQSGFGLTDDINLYTGLNYGYTLSMETLEIFTGLEKMINNEVK